MTLFLLIIGIIFAGSLLLMLVEIFRAPLGQETEHGFELPWRNWRHGAQEVSQVWPVRHEAVGRHGGGQRRA